MPSPVLADALSVLELRQYTLHPGRRDELVALFEREFVETQEDAGIRLVATFRDLDDPDRFVWLRGFADMASRAQGLAAFYGGPVWQRHRDAANATMVDSDDVHLLRPVGEFLGDTTRAPVGASARPAGIVTATICPLPALPDDALVADFDHLLAPAWTDAGARLIARLVTEASPNNFPRLPVHEGKPVFVWLSLFPDAAAPGPACARCSRRSRASGSRSRRR